MARRERRAPALPLTGGGLKRTGKREPAEVWQAVLTLRRAGERPRHAGPGRHLLRRAVLTDAELILRAGLKP